MLTDAVQMIFMLIASVSFAVCAFSFTGGYETLLTGMNGYTGEFGSIFSRNGLDVFLGFGLPTAIGLFAGPFGDQSFWQRAFAVNKNKIGSAFGVGAILFAVVPLSMGILGYIAAGSGMEITDTSIVNLELIRSLLPDWALIPFLFMIISGLLSTTDSNLCSFASLMYSRSKQFSVKSSKIGMLVMLAAAVCIANIPHLTVSHLFLLYGTFRASTMLPTVMTLKNVKLSAKGVCCGVILSMLIGIPVFAYGTITDTAVLKTAGSLITLLLSGITALVITKIISKREVQYETSC